MTADQIGVLQSLSKNGYAIAIWSARELEGINPRVVEQKLTELGYAVIGELKSQQQEIKL